MANIKSAKKRAIQSEKHRQRNTSLRSMYRTYVKKVLIAVEDKSLESAQTAFKEAVPVIDKMVNKKIIHKNKAARLKSRLSAKIKLLAA